MPSQLLFLERHGHGSRARLAARPRSQRRRRRSAPASSRMPSSGARTGERFELCSSSVDHPHRPRGEPGFGGGCRAHDPPRAGAARADARGDELGRGARLAGCRRARAPSNPASRRASSATTSTAEYGQCRATRSRAGRTVSSSPENHKGVYRSGDGRRDWESIADGLLTDFGLRSWPTRVDRSVIWKAWSRTTVSGSHRRPDRAAVRTTSGSSWRTRASGSRTSRSTACARGRWSRWRRSSWA